MDDDQTLQIKNYKNWIVADARHDCEQLGLELEVTNGDTASTRTEQATIEKNADSSPPGTPIEAGGIVSVVIFPLEPRQ